MKALRVSPLTNLITPLLLFLPRLGSCITLLSVLQSYPQLSTLYSLINGTSNGTALLSSASNFTFLAPNNDAIKTFLASNPNAFADGGFDAYLEYGLLEGGYPSLSFTNDSQFVASNLTDARWANVTGGQRVELVLGDGEPTVVSGNKSVSGTSGTEIVCVGGIIHIIDTVLTIPLTTVLELTAANLEFFISILNAGNYLSTSNVDYVNDILEVPDVTYFVPNSAGALANATKLLQNASDDEKKALFQYHIVPDFVGYSDLLVDKMSLKTAQGEDIIITRQDGELFVNSARVTSTDWIVANGVVHVLEELLDRFDTSPPPPPQPTTSTSTSATSTPTSTATPSPTLNAVQTTSAASSKDSGLNIGAQVGIGVGTGIFGLGLIAALAFFFFRSRKQRPNSAMWDSGSMSGVPNDMGKYYVRRGTILRQEDPGLGLGSTGIHDQISPIDRGDVGTMGTETTVGGPEIPARSPTRGLREENYF